MRVLLGGFHHESDSFNPITTKESDIFVSRAVDDKSSFSENAISGIVQALRDLNHEIIYSLYARAVPNGEWDEEYYLKLKEEFLAKLKECKQLDGIALALHGSMRVKNIGSAEEDLLTAIREIYPNIPIACSLDMHANINVNTLLSANIFVGYKCAPHTDAYQTGYDTILLLDKLLHSTKMFISAAFVPFIIAGEMSETNNEPMKSIMSKIREWEKDDNILSLSLLMGFPWSDNKDVKVTAIAISSLSKEHAIIYSKKVAQLVWGKREEFCFCSDTYEMDESIERVKELLQDNIFPIVLSDSGDNPTAGSSQDVTTYLELLLKDEELSRLNPPLVYQGFYDPEAIDLIFKANIGDTISISLGALFDKRTSNRLSVECKVVARCEGYKRENNRIALVNINGINVVVTQNHVACYELEMMRALNIEPREQKVIVVKLGYLEPDIKSIAKESLLVLTPGATNEVFTRLEYKNLKRPIFPFDKDYEAEFYDVLS